MHLISQVIKRYKNLDSLKGITLGICLHITKETAVLIIGLKQLGANVYLCSANPLSTQESIVSFLRGKKSQYMEKEENPFKTLITIYIKYSIMTQIS